MGRVLDGCGEIAEGAAITNIKEFITGIVSIDNNGASVHLIHRAYVV